VLVGFAAETDDLLTNARAKLTAKRLDLIVANLVGREGSGFGSEHNEAVLVQAGKQDVSLPSQTKIALAHAVLDRAVGLLAS
jgi:phosphopantothenoylcysteine decarboxylase / phosphopantothenate---cysteine ligase